jgi:DeoR/GlpR family transcriptional regulator of sugar metabolism
MPGRNKTLLVHRRREIVDTTSRSGRITVAEICQRFGVSTMTARRDLRDLDREGALRRAHGGAVSILGRSYEIPYSLRTAQATHAKKLIGRKAAEMVLEGESVGLDVGTTTLEVARALCDKRNLTIVTSSLRIGAEAAAIFPLGSGVRLILTGGIVRAGELSMIGHIAQTTFRELHVDKAFIGVAGISLEDGLTEYNLEDTEVKQNLIASARHSIVVAEGSKLGRTTFCTIAPLSAIHTIVTDRSAPQSMLTALAERGMRVVVAD